MAAISNALQGLASAESQFNTAASKIAEWGLPQAGSNGVPQGDTIDLSAEAVAVLQARNNFEANTKMIKVADQMDQTLLNVIG